ncbi:hypothetical protein [Pseudomonas sp. CC120222-01a]|uniref:hypothetical protein n=1 Tax=Pseudomonas sp. CC120222-01a TaxID=1378075 RepID=UPI000D87F37B|nr:hypothetical protein [Pseudomonas sp. CC120222-01a]PVZ43535.1 hypothetical protein N430_00005 [Pseudomonas sp. CC120222-01a]
MSMSYEFQLAYTISPEGKEHEGDAAVARTHLREEMGWKTSGKVETTLHGKLVLSPGTKEEKRKEASKSIRTQIRDAFKALEVDKTVSFAGSLMVSGLDPAIKIGITPD